VIGKSRTPKGGHKLEFEKEYSHHGSQHSNVICKKIIDFFSSCTTYEIIRERKLPLPLEFCEDFNPALTRVAYHKIGPGSMDKKKWVFRSNMVSACTLLGIGYLRADGKIMTDGDPDVDKVWFVIEAESDCSGSYVIIYDGGYEYYHIRKKTMKITETPLPVAHWTGRLKPKDRKKLRLCRADKELMDKMIEITLKPTS
jgi:hypothetical protein